jgi:hypothetical protein
MFIVSKMVKTLQFIAATLVSMNLTTKDAKFYTKDTKPDLSGKPFAHFARSLRSLR